MEPIKEALINAVTEIQESSGRPMPVISGATRPLSDLAGFDSLNAVEVSFLLSEHFQCEIDSNLLLSTGVGKHLTIDEATEQLTQILNRIRGGAHD